MEQAPDQSSVIVHVYLIDELKFRRAALSHFLQERASEEGIVLQIHDPMASHDSPESPLAGSLTLVSVGGDRLVAPGALGVIEAWSRRLPESPVVVLSDRDDDVADVVAAVRAGARGYIGTRLDPGVIIGALRFIVCGGSFFPPSALLGSTAGGALLEEECLSEPEALRCGSVQAGSLTGRQQEVFHLLRQGQSNKRIARELNMCESTVKVHVRQIMRKLGASNRTQAALSIMQNVPRSALIAVGSS